MNINEALELFGMDLMEVSKDTLKKRYRELMKKNHPDLDGNTEIAQNINEAHSLLQDSLNRIAVTQANANARSNDKRIFVITIDQLINIYSGKQLKTSGKEPVIIGIRDLKKLNIMLNACVSIQYVNTGKTLNFESLTPYDIKDVYRVECGIPIKDISTPEPIKLKCLDKNIEINLDNDKTIRLRFDNNVIVEVAIKRRVVTEENGNGSSK